MTREMHRLRLSDDWRGNFDGNGRNCQLNGMESGSILAPIARNLPPVSAPGEAGQFPSDFRVGFPFLLGGILYIFLFTDRLQHRLPASRNMAPLFAFDCTN